MTGQRFNNERDELITVHFDFLRLVAQACCARISVSQVCHDGQDCSDDMSLFKKQTLFPIAIAETSYLEVQPHDTLFVCIAFEVYLHTHLLCLSLEALQCTGFISNVSNSSVFILRLEGVGVLHFP